MADFWDGTPAGVAGALAGAVAGFLASCVANYLNRRATRKDVKIDSVRNLVEELKTLSISYWRTKGRDDPIERRIITILESIPDRVDELRAFGVSAALLERAQTHVGDLYDAATGGQFQSMARPIDHERIDLIRQKASQFQTDLSEADIGSVRRLIRQISGQGR